MAVTVLIVDDSGFFRNRIEETLKDDGRIQVVGTAVNGKEAVEKARLLKPDVITMDVEMPQLNGIEAVRIIMRECPTNVMMLSSLTHEGARVTLQALEAGAVDYLPKDIRAWMDRSNTLRQELVDRIVALGKSRRYRASLPFGRPPASEQTGSSMVFRPQRPKADTPQQPAARMPEARTSAVAGMTSRSVADTTRGAATAASRVRIPDCRLVVIASSTGGPAALQKIITALPASFPYPILLVQHMPKTFTKVFAERLDQQSRIRVKEAEDNDRLEPGVALLCPGGMQMMIDPRQTGRVKILEGDERLTYKPSADVTYASVAKTYGSGALGVILTGMGADGCDGARLLKQAGSTMWAQSKETCTIYGMPQAVVNAGLADAILDLDDISDLLAAKQR